MGREFSPCARRPCVGDTNEGGYDVVLLGQNGVTKIDLDALEERLERADHSSVLRSMRSVGFRSAIDLLSTYAGRAADLRPWLERAEINRDLNLRLQYLAGMGVNSNQSAAIYDQMLLYRRFPKDLFAGSDERLQAFQMALALTGSGQ